MKKSITKTVTCTEDVHIKNVRNGIDNNLDAKNGDVFNVIFDGRFYKFQNGVCLNKESFEKRFK